MDTSQRTRRGRRPALAAAILAVCAFGSVPALAQLPLGPEITVPLPISEGTDGSSPGPPTTTTTTTVPPPPSTTPTTTAAPASTAAPGATTPTSPSAGGAGSETARRSTGPSRRASTATAPAAEESFDVAPAAAEDAPTVARLRQVTLPAARQFGFPLGLAALVLAFLAVQGRLDARDPKLAAAPLSIDDDLLPFT